MKFRLATCAFALVSTLAFAEPTTLKYQLQEGNRLHTSSHLTCDVEIPVEQGTLHQSMQINTTGVLTVTSVDENGNFTMKFSDFEGDIHCKMQPELGKEEVIHESIDMQSQEMIEVRQTPYGRTFYEDLEKSLSSVTSLCQQDGVCVDLTKIFTPEIFSNLQRVLSSYYPQVAIQENDKWKESWETQDFVLTQKNKVKALDQNWAFIRSKAHFNTKHPFNIPHLEGLDPMSAEVAGSFRHDLSIDCLTGIPNKDFFKAQFEITLAKTSMEEGEEEESPLVVTITLHGSSHTKLL